MGFPYEPASWDGVSGPIFMGTGSSLPGTITVIAIIVAILMLVFGQKTEAGKYRDHK